MKYVRANNQSLLRRMLRSRAILAINLILVGFVGWSLGKEVSQGNKVTSNLNDLKEKLANLQKQNQNYGDILSKLNTPGFVDKEARIKLGYQKPDERVLILKDSVAALAADSSAVAPDDTSGLSNPQKWWWYFFGGN